MAVHVGDIGFGGQLDSALLRHGVQLVKRLGPDVGIEVVQPGFQVSQLLVAHSVSTGPVFYFNTSFRASLRGARRIEAVLACL